MIANITLGFVIVVGLALLIVAIQAARKPILAKMGLRNIPRRPMQSTLIILGLTLSTTIIISALSIGDTLNQSVSRQAVRAYGEVDEILAPPLIGTLTEFGLVSEDGIEDFDEAESNLLAGGVDTLLALVEEGLPGISQERYDALWQDAQSEPLIDGVAPAIIFPTIIRDTTSGQGEPFGFIFAVDEQYQTDFGLTEISGQTVDVTSLRPGVGNVFEVTSNVLALQQQVDVNQLIQDLNLDEVDLQNLDIAAIDIAALGLGVGTVGALLASQNLEGLLSEDGGVPSLEQLGLDQLAQVRDDPIGTANAVLSTINLNTVGSDIDNTLGQLGLSLRQGEVYLNAVGAEMLNARQGDILEVYIGPIPLPYRVKGIVTEAGPMSALSPVVVMSLPEAQHLLFMEGQVNTVLISNEGDALTGLEVTDAVNERLRVLSLNESAAAALGEQLRNPEFARQLDREITRSLDDDLDGPPDFVIELVNDLVPINRMSDELIRLRDGLNEPGLNETLKQALASRQIQFWLLEGDDVPADQAETISTLVQGLTELELVEPIGKQTVVNAANAGGLVSSSIFSLFGIFSIMAGMLLIFMIFVMLAAERRSEMGMARAIGVQRSHLVQMFVTEGVVYDLVSSAVGIGLGLLLSYALVGFIGNLFNDIVNQISQQGQGGVFAFEFAVAPRSIIIAYCAGVLLTFIVVTIASWRISRLNIVAAIRDLPERTFTRKQTWWGRIWALLLGIVLIAASYFTFQSGPIEATRIQLSVSLLLTGLTFTLHWLLSRTKLHPPLRDRLIYSMLGIGLLLTWIIPWTPLTTEQGTVFQQDPRTVLLSFAVSGPLIILGAILTIMFNADTLLDWISRFLSRIGPLVPILKTAIAYPLNARFRTGVAMLLFAMIITTVTIMAVVIEATQTTLTPAAERNAGFDIQVNSTLLSLFNPINDLTAEIEALSDFPQDDIQAVARLSQLEVRGRQQAPITGGQRTIPLAGLNADYISQAGTIYKFEARAPGFETDEAVWQALRERTDVGIIMANLARREQPEDSENNNGSRGDDFERRWRFRLNGFTLPADKDPTYELPEIHVNLQPSDNGVVGVTGQAQSIQIIGVLAQDTPLVSSRRIQVNDQVLAQLSGLPVVAETFYVKVAPEADMHTVAQEIERAFIGGGLNTVILNESFAAGQAITRGILQLFQGFMALGLLVGIAALGVISSRTVVERRQQVGVLRAIGYQSHMVALIFVIESSFIALSGLGIGVITGVVLGQNIVGEFYSLVTEGQAFSMPWLQIGLILLGAYLFSMLTAIAPAYQASRIYPAEALRYN
ncbi:MAG: FtsX-like permease family protein [Chloroflexota bacterium]